MDTGNYQYSQYETAAEFDTRVNTYSSGQQNMMSQQSGMFPQQSGGMMSHQSGMSQQWDTMTHQTSMMPQQSGMMFQQSGMSQQWDTMSYQTSSMPQQSGMMPQQSGMMSQQSGMSQQWNTMTHQTGTMPQQSGMMSQQSGMMSQQSGMMPHQSGMMPQQSGMMSQQSGSMFQQSGGVSQQSGMWGKDMQQSTDMWTPQQQDGTMGMTNNTNFPPQFSNNYGPLPARDGNTMGQSSQQFTNMSQQHQGNGSMCYDGGRGSFQGTENFNSFQQRSNNSGYQQDTSRNNNQPTYQQTGPNMMNQQDTFRNNNQTTYQQGGPNMMNQQNTTRNNNQPFFQQGGSNMMNQQDTSRNNNQPFYQQGGGNMMKQQDTFRNNNQPFNQQGGQNMMNQQRNSGLQLQQNPSYHQENGSSFQPNERSTNNMNEVLDDFYQEIGNMTEETDANFQEQSLQGSKNSGIGQQSDSVSSSTQSSSNKQQCTGQKPPEANTNNQTGTGKSNVEKESVEKGGKPHPTQNVDSAATAEENIKHSEFDDDDTEYCKLCNVYFTSPPLYALHVRGLSHIQRMMAVEAGKDRKPAEKPYIISGKSYTQTVPQEPINKKQNETEQQSDETVLNAGCYCEVCDIHVNNERMLWRHYQGKKHHKALKAIEKGELKPKPATQWPVDPNIEKAAKLVEAEVPDGEVSSLNFAFDTIPADEPIVGLGFLVETMENMNQVIDCELCKTTGNLYNMVQHVLGLKHRLQYLKVRDRERYDSIKKTTKKAVQSEEARVMCLELEKTEGRGTARYNGPPRRMPKEEKRRLLGRAVTPPPAHLLRYREQQNMMSESEKRLAIESLKRTLLDDFHKRNIDPDTATKILNSRMELLAEYEKRGVPFVVARERVIEEEERWNLLLEFERQVLSFDEAEQRIDHRFELMKMYEKNGFPKEEARRKVLDDEVIYDFKRDFVRLGLQREQAQKLAERRLWMLEHLHYQGLTPEAASEKVIVIERELKHFLRAMFEADRRGRSRDSQAAQWMIAGEELENYIVQSSKELGLSRYQTEDQVNLALEAFDGYRNRRIPADEAKCRVLIDDLPIPRQQVERGLMGMEMESAEEPGSQADITNRVQPAEEPGSQADITNRVQPAEEPGSQADITNRVQPTEEPGSQADITNRVQQFKTKLNATLQTTEDPTPNDDKQTDKKKEEVDQEKLEDYDQQSRTEIQNLLSDMLKMKVPPDEARRRLVALYKQHESLRENLFPAKKQSGSSVKNKPGSQEDSKKPENVPVSTGGQSSEETSTKKPSSEKKASKTDSSAAEKVSVDNSDKKVTVTAEKDSGGKTQPETVTKKSNPKRSTVSQSGDNAGSSPESKKLTTANERWNSSVEMFLQQYGLSKEEYLSQMNRRRNSGHERYSPSDLSPRRSRSPDRSHRSPGSERRRRSRSRSASSRWSRMFKSRLRSRSPHRRSSFSPGYRGRPRSGERDRDSRGPRRSPSRRSLSRRSPSRSPRHWSPSRRSPFSRRSRSRFSPGRRSPSSGRSRSRFSPGRRSPRSRFSPERRSPPRRRSPFGRRSPPGRRFSPSRWSPYSRENSPDRWRASPGRSWGHPDDFNPYSPGGYRPGRSRSRDRHYSPRNHGSPRPRWNRYRSPPRQPEFNFADGVWPDMDDPWD